MRYTKDPQARLDYAWEWQPWMNEGEAISTAVVTVPNGLTHDSSEDVITNTRVTAWISGGTVGQDYVVSCRITTNQGRVDERTDHLSVENR